MTKFQHAVTSIPAEWANAVDGIIYGLLGNVKTVDDLRRLLGLKDLAFSDGQTMPDGVVLSNPALHKAVAEFVAAQVLQSPTHDLDVTNKEYVDAVFRRVEQVLAGVVKDLGSMASQNDNAVTITGGVIDGTRIGANSPNEAAFTQAFVTEVQEKNPSSIVNVAALKNAVLLLKESLGSMAAQDACSVAITGGAIDGVTLGGSADVNGHFNKATISASPVNPNDAVNKVSMDMAIRDATNRVMAALTQLEEKGKNIGTDEPVSVAASTLSITGGSNIPSRATLVVANSGEGPGAGMYFAGLSQDSARGGLEVLGTRKGKEGFTRLFSNRGILVEGAEMVVAVRDSGFSVSKNAVTYISAKGSALALGNPTVDTVAHSFKANTVEAETVTANRFVGKADKTHARGAVTAEVQLDLANTEAAYLELQGGRRHTLTFLDGGLSDGVHQYRMVVRVLDAGNTLVFPTSVQWAHQSPVLDFSWYPAGAFQIIDLITFDKGTTWLAMAPYKEQSPFDTAGHGANGYGYTTHRGQNPPEAWSTGEAEDSRTTDAMHNGFTRSPPDTSEEGTSGQTGSQTDGLGGQQGNPQQDGGTSGLSNSSSEAGGAEGSAGTENSVGEAGTGSHEGDGSDVGA